MIDTHAQLTGNCAGVLSLGKAKLESRRLDQVIQSCKASQ